MSPLKIIKGSMIVMSILIIAGFGLILNKIAQKSFERNVKSMAVSADIQAPVQSVKITNVVRDTQAPVQNTKSMAASADIQAPVQPVQSSKAPLIPIPLETEALNLSACGEYACVLASSSSRQSHLFIIDVKTGQVMHTLNFVKTHETN